MNPAGRFLPVRALAAFATLPGMVAYIVPAWIGAAARYPLRYPAAAALFFCLGTTLLLWCVREFYRAGRGTLAPWDPPRHLVTSGPYRLSRNPMYLGVELILVGWCTLWGSRTLIIYTLLVMIAFYARVRLAEEPWARRRFGAEWQAYQAKVPRWIV
jgi:protein-S-isoprenylcysteine O-methyltransferase Ste14